MKANIPEFVPEAILQFAKLLHTKVIDNRIDIPEQYGQGYCLGYKFNDHIRMLILNYELKKDLLLTNPDTDITRPMILFKFEHVFQGLDNHLSGLLPSVLIATRMAQANISIPVHTHTATINIEIDTEYLSNLFQSSRQSATLNSLLANKQPLLFEQTIYPAMLKVLEEILHEPIQRPFQLFFLRIKAEELVCRLLMELEKRQEKQLLPLNHADIQTLFAVKTKILEHLDTPPSLDLLADFALMSTSKLKILFKQIFGKSIYSYYQGFRMQEAARLLTQRKLTVSEVGYQLGFSNLSHFTRVFEQHMGTKPKKYSMQSTKNL